MQFTSQPSSQHAQSPVRGCQPKHRVQAKLLINEPGDVYEQEADAMSEKIMRTPSKEKGAAAVTGLIGASVQRKCSACEEAEKKKRPLMRKAEPGSGGMPASPSLVSFINTSKGGGEPLPRATRNFMEHSFSNDFSSVRLHTDSRASEVSRGINAKAFTHGSDIYFKSGEYNQDSPEGKKLLAHELTHVVQQRGSVPFTTQRNNQSGRQTPGPLPDKKGISLLTEKKGPALQREDGPALEKEEESKLTEADLSWAEKAMIEAQAAPYLALGATAHKMVKATLRGFVLEVKAQSKTKGPQFLSKLKEALTSPAQIAAIIVHYWWGLIKGIFSPITGLFDLGLLVVKLGALQAQIINTGWSRREELAEDLRQISESLSGVTKKGRTAITNLLSHPLETVLAITPWLATFENQAEAAAEGGGRKAGGLLMSQLDKPLPELGEIAGEIIGTVLINIVLLVFTEGIGNAITQVASKIGEFGAFLGKFGQAAQMLGKLAAGVGELLGTIGGWITKVEAAIAKLAEVILKPLMPLLKELGNTVQGLKAFFQKLLSVSEKEGAVIADQLGAGATKAVKAPGAAIPHIVPVEKPPVVPSRINTGGLADEGTGVAGSKVSKGAGEVKAPPTENIPVKKPTVVPEKPMVIKGEPGSRRAAIGEGHEIVEVPDGLMPSGIGCELHSPAPFPKVPCPVGMGTRETVDEFLKRGGKIEKLPPGKTPEKLPSETTSVGKPQPRPGYEDHPNFKNNSKQGRALGSEEPPTAPDRSPQKGLFNKTPEEIAEQEAIRERGNTFNTEREGAYKHNEVEIESPFTKGKRVRLDSYDNGIISRKYPAGATLDADRAIENITELVEKYPIGARIANTPKNRAAGLAGKLLEGPHILEVPVLLKEVPQEVLDFAQRAGVIIRDSSGRIYR